MTKEKKLLIAKILLTFTAVEFFGPALRDANESHLMNAAWPGHARVHMMWLIMLMVMSGIVNIYLIWFRKPFTLRNLYLVFAWQTCNLVSFWTAAILAPAYGGAVIDGVYHTEIFGINENYVAFIFLTSLTIASFAFFQRRVVPDFKEAA